LDGWNESRRRAAGALRDALEAAGARVEVPAEAPPWGDHVHHLFVVRSDDRDGLRAGLADRGVATAVHYPFALHRAEAYAGLRLQEGSLPVSEGIAARVLSLPMFPGMTDEEIETVAAAVAEVAG
jgi:dTDP-4-amino-4,6-dideoxygalactose transaminase